MSLDSLSDELFGLLKLAVIVNMLDCLLLSGVVLVFERPQLLILVNVLLVLAAEWQPEVVEELITHDFLLVADLALNHLAFLDLFLAIDLAVLLTVVLLKCLYCLVVKNVIRAGSEVELTQVGDLFKALQRNTKHGVDFDIAQLLIEKTGLLSAMRDEEAAELIPSTSGLLVESLVTGCLLELECDDLSRHLVCLLKLKLLTCLTQSGFGAFSSKIWLLLFDQVPVPDGLSSCESAILL